VSIKITRSSATAKPALIGGHYTIQGHSRSLISVPIKSSYVTSWQTD